MKKFFTKCKAWAKKVIDIATTVVGRFMLLLIGGIVTAGCFTLAQAIYEKKDLYDIII